MPGGITPPLGVIESWPAPNYAAERDSSGVMALMLIFYILAVLIICARMTARYASKNFGLDDILISIAVIPMTGLLIVCCLYVDTYKLDLHAWDMLPMKLVKARKMVLAFEIFYIYASGFIKLSILCFNRRLASGSRNRAFDLVVTVGMVLVVLYMIGFTISQLAECRPFSAMWMQVVDYILAPDTYHCGREDIAILANTIMSTALDFTAAILPFTLFWNLEMPKQQKIALGAIFAVGFSVCFVGVYRIVLVYRTFWSTYDVPYFTRTTFVVTVVEITLGAMCASAPALKIFFNIVYKHANSSYKLDSQKSAECRTAKEVAKRKASKTSNPFGSSSHGFHEVTVESFIGNKDKDIVYGEEEVYDMDDYESGSSDAPERRSAWGNELKSDDMVIRMHRELEITEEIV